MNERPLRFRRIDIRRAPGFEDGGFPVEDLCGGVNIIHGPNASGKTTLADSIAGLLWPGRGRERSWLVGRFDLDGEEWVVEVESGHGRYQRNGQDASAPLLPGADQSDRYRLSLHDLLQHETRNEDFAEAVLRESAGGYDIQAAAERLGYRDRPSGAGIIELRDAEDAAEKVEAARRAVDELREEQDRLAGLERRLEKIRTARRRIKLIKDAAKFAAARDRLEEAENRLRELPDVLEKVSGDEVERLEDIEEQIQEWTRTQEKAQDRREEAQRELREAGLPEEGVPEELLKELTRRRERARELKVKLDDLDRQLAGLRRRRDKELRQFAGEVPEEKLAEIDPVAWRELSEFATEAQEVLADRTALDALETVLEPEEEPSNGIETLRAARSALEDWLRGPSSSTDEAFGGRHLPLVLVAAVGVVGILLGLLAPAPVFGLGLLVVASGAAAVLYVRDRWEREDGRRFRSEQEERVRELDVEGPADWTRENVRQALESIYRGIADHHVVERLARARKNQLAGREEIEERERAVEQKREDLIRRYGVAPETGAVALADLADSVRRWRDAQTDLDAAEEERREAQNQLERELSKINERLDPYVSVEVGDAAEAAAHIQNLQARVKQFDNARRDLQTAQATLEEAGEKLSEFHQRRVAVFTGVGLEAGDTDRLRELCELHEEYIQRCRERDERRAVRNSERRELRHHEEHDPELEERSLAGLEEEKRELKETAGEYEDVWGEISRIRDRIEQAKQRHEVEDAMAERDRAMDALREKLQQDRGLMVGQVLADYVRQESSEAGRPAVFSGARQVLTNITRGRYRLDMEEGSDPTFRAYDTVRERGFALDELSSATRLQVLLAVRIAFVQHQEDSVRLPILLDETLANTDDAKARVIIDSAIELAREGRQIFYFTAQGDEVARWQAALQQAGDVQHTVTNLAQIQNLDRQVEVPDLAAYTEERPHVPAPDGPDHEAYGEKIGVHPFDPCAGAGSAHVWYVVGDVEVLHRLLELGIRRWGQLRNLLETGDRNLISDEPEVLERLQENGSALEAFVQAWRIGRGRPVDRTVLEDSGAVSDKFIDQVSELARQLDGDGQAIVDALAQGEVKGFYSNKREELEEYLLEHGHIDPLETLEEGEVRRRIMSRLIESDLPHEEAVARADQLLSRLASRTAR